MGNCVKKLAAELLSAAIAVTMISGPVPAYAAEPQGTPAPQESDEMILLEEDIEENMLLTLGGTYTLTNVLVNTETLKGTSELSVLKAFEDGSEQEPGETLPKEKETEKQTETATGTNMTTEPQGGAPQAPEQITEKQTEAMTETEAPKQTEAATEKQTEESEKNETMTKTGGESESETEAGKHETGTETGTTGESETGTADENKTGESETGTTDENKTGESETGTTDDTGTGTTDESETGTTDESKTGKTGTETGETGESKSNSETEKSKERESEGEKEYKTDFLFENDEVKITVTAKEEAQLPMDTELAAEKLAEDSEVYIESKATADAQSGSDPAATSYVFYSVKLLAGGEVLHPEDGMLTMQIEFKNISADENTSEDIVCIKDTAEGKVAENVASATEGSTLSSVDFEL